MVDARSSGRQRELEVIRAFDTSILGIVNFHEFLIRTHVIAHSDTEFELVSGVNPCFKALVQYFPLESLYWTRFWKSIGDSLSNRLLFSPWQHQFTYEHTDVLNAIRREPGAMRIFGAFCIKKLMSVHTVAFDCVVDEYFNTLSDAEAEKMVVICKYKGMRDTCAMMVKKLFNAELKSMDYTKETESYGRTLPSFHTKNLKAISDEIEAELRTITRRMTAAAPSSELIPSLMEVKKKLTHDMPVLCRVVHSAISVLQA